MLTIASACSLSAGMATYHASCSWMLKLSPTSSASMALVEVVSVSRLNSLHASSFVHNASASSLVSMRWYLCFTVLIDAIGVLSVCTAVALLTLSVVSLRAIVFC